MRTPRPSAPVASGLALLLLAAAARSQSGGGDEEAALRGRLEVARPDERAPLLLQLAQLRRSDPAEVVALTGEAIALLDRFPAAETEVELRLGRAVALQTQGDYPAALADAQHAEQVARRAGDVDLRAAALFMIACVEWRTAAYEAAISHAETARALQAPKGRSLALLNTLTVLAAVRQEQGDYEAALRGYLEALEMARALGDEWSIAQSANNVGLAYWKLGRFEPAHRSLLQALEIHERVGPATHLAKSLNNLGLVLIDLGRPREAVAVIERSLAMDVDGPYGRAKNYTNLGVAHQRLGEPARALDFHRRALALREEIGDRSGIANSRGAIGALLLEGGDAAAATEHLAAAVALAGEIGARHDEARLLQRLSSAREAAGDAAGALADHRRFHALRMEVEDRASRERIAELEARHQAAERDREIAALEAEAAAQQAEIDRILIGSAVLGGCAVLLGVLFWLRVRSQRALAESERRYRALFRTSVVPTLLIDREGRRVVDLNEPAAGLCGELPPGGRAIADVEPEWVRVALERLFEPDVAEPFAIDDCWIDANGRTRWSEVRGSSVALAGRACLLVSVRETTDTRAQEEARLREDRIRSLGTMAGGIAHDFNNALTAIGGHIVLAKQSGGAHREELLALAEQAAFRARGLTRQLLAFAKGGAPVRRIVQVGPLLRDGVRLANAGSNLRVEVDVPDDLWLAELDRSQFQQVVSNLVLNAQQASPAGGNLRVRAANFVGDPATGKRVGERRYVRIDFTDDGPGIAEPIRERVFDPYFTTKSGGSGLGLATAFTICSRHGGTLTLESREGRGTVFHAFFPAVDDVHTAPAPVVEGAPSGGGSVLVLDDEPLVRSVVRRMLEKWGFEVEVVADGAAAVRLHAERLRAGRPFDLLIMDLTIPGGMGGREALAAILEQNPRARAIVASGYSDDPILARHREAGFVAALAKPFDYDGLARAVNAALVDAPAASE